MCVAVPMKVIEVNRESDTATVALHGNEMKVNISLIYPNVGDHVLVHAGCAIEIVKADMALEIMDILNELEELTK